MGDVHSRILEQHNWQGQQVVDPESVGFRSSLVIDIRERGELHFLPGEKRVKT